MAYRYSSCDFHTLQDTIWHNDQPLYLENLRTLNARLKNQTQLVVSQRLGENKGTLFLSGVRRTFWNSPKHINQFQFSYSNRYKKLSYNLGYSHTYDSEENKTDKRVYASVSIPMGDSSAPTLSSSYSTNGDNSQRSVSISGSLGQARNWNYGVGYSGSDSGSAISANLGYDHRYVSLSSTAAQDSNRNRQFCLGKWWHCRPPQRHYASEKCGRQLCNHSCQRG